MRLGLMLLSVIMIVGCKKNEHDAPITKTPQELLTQKQWTITALGFDVNADGKIDVTENVLIDCEKSSTYVFNPNGTGAVHDAPPTCSPSLDNDFTWTLLENNQKIQINQQDLFILRLTENELLLKAEMPGIPTDFLASYTH